MDLKKIAIGSAQFGMDYGISNKIGKLSYSSINDILTIANKNDINTIDTAHSYGESELQIGKYLHLHPNEDWEIITKVSICNNSLEDKINQTIYKLGSTPTVILFHNSYEYLDSKNIEELMRIKEKFDIEKIGVSVYTMEEIDNVISHKIPDVVQLPINILDTRLYKNGCLDHLDELNIEIHARSIFLQGLFYLKKNNIPSQFSEVIPYLEQLNEISNTQKLTIPELSLLWVLSLHQIKKVIIGIESSAQLLKNIQTAELNVHPSIFEDALNIEFHNDNILDPSKWN